jgi:hypothetical protein
LPEEAGGGSTKAKPKRRRSYEDPEGFTAFWAAYPRRVDREEAVKAFPAACAEVGGPEALVALLRRYRFSDDLDYVAHPATWLRKRRWTDSSRMAPVQVSPPPPLPSGGGAPAPSATSEPTLIPGLPQGSTQEQRDEWMAWLRSRTEHDGPPPDGWPSEVAEGINGWDLSLPYRVRGYVAEDVFDGCWKRLGVRSDHVQGLRRLVHELLAEGFDRKADIYPVMERAAPRLARREPLGWRWFRAAVRGDRQERAA